MSDFTQAIVATQPAFVVGQRVRTNGSFLSPARDGRIAEIATNRFGATIYILQDGGWFNADELSAAR